MMFTMLNRMCWNSRGWRLPTNTSKDGGYPEIMGFGHEEWNFQIEDEVNGFVYGYLYLPKPADKIIKQANGHFRIGFWSLHPETSERLLVGLYNNAVLSSTKDMSRVDQAFESKGIYERRISELHEAAGDNLSYEKCSEEVNNAVKNHLLNYKCPVDKVEHLHEYVPVADFLKSKRLGLRFKNPTYVPSNELPEFPKRISPVSDDIESLQQTAALTEDAYYRESEKMLRRIIPRHNKLSNSFGKWLADEGYVNVAQENNYVDVSFGWGDIIFKAELKVCYGVGSTKAIREALGQLLEYNYYGARKPANYWVIILDEKATEKDIDYINLLKTKLGLPIFLGWKDRDSFIFAETLPRE